MKLTVQELARQLGGEFSGNGNALLTGAAGLSEATPSDVSFLGDPKYSKELPRSQAGAVLLKKGAPAEGRTVIWVDHPPLAFAQVLAILEAERRPPEGGIHPTAVIDPGARLGTGVSVGPYAVIESGCSVGDHSSLGAHCVVGRRSSIGKDCRIHPLVTLREETELGDRVIIHSGTVIGSDGFGYATVDGVHRKIPQIGRVVIEDDVEIGANVTIDRATVGKTVVGKGSKIDNLVQIAHNVRIGPGCILVAQAGVAGSSTLGRFVTLAGQVGVVGHVTLGDGVICAAQSGIPNDVPAGSIVFGSPARPIQEERRIQVIIGKLPELYDDLRKIKKTLNLKKDG